MIPYKERMKYSSYWVLGAIMAVGIILRAINLGVPDVASDDALYSLRSIGWVDYVASTNLQSTPISWFDTPQWWQGLSFHDAPPLVFAAQRIFFATGGDNVIAARLPFVAAGTALIATVFLLTSAVAGTYAGLAAAGAVAVMNYAVGASRIGLLDGFAALWTACALYFFIKAGTRPKSYLWWGLAAGLGMLTKYTFVFLVPVFCIGFLLWRRRDFRRKWVWLGVGVLFTVLLPLIVYTVMMWRERGHPDAALATMIGQHPADFQGLVRETHALRDAPRAAVKIFTDNFSNGFRLLFLWGIVAAVFRTRRTKNMPERRDLILLGLAFVSGIAIVSMAGGSDRFGVILVPLVAVALGIGISEAWRYAYGWRAWACTILIGSAILWEAVFAVQSQLLPHPPLPSPMAIARNRPAFTGYRFLEDYVAGFYREFPEPSPIVIFKDEPQLATLQKQWIEARLGGVAKPVFQKHLLVFDDRISWFAWVWIFERRRLYDSAPIHSIGQFLEKMDASGGTFYTQLGLGDATVIVADDDLLEREGTQSPDAYVSFTRELAAAGKPMYEIRAYDGRTLFRVFRLSLAPVGR